MNLRYAGSRSVLHDPTGLSLTLSGGTDDVEDGSNPYNLYGKVGDEIAWFGFGHTDFGLDYTYSENLTVQGDVGQSVGVHAFVRMTFPLFIRWIAQRHRPMSR